MLTNSYTTSFVTLPHTFCIEITMVEKYLLACQGTIFRSHQSDQLPITVANNYMHVINYKKSCIMMLFIGQLIDSLGDGSSGDTLNETVWHFFKVSAYK